MPSRLVLGVLAVLAMLEFTPPTNTPVSTVAVPQQTTPPIVVAPIPTTSVPQKPLQGAMGADYQQVVTVPLVAPDSPCQQWVPLAIASGWPEDREVIEPLVNIMWRESRCSTESWYKVDPNGGSRGLLQINGFWCQPSRYWPDGYLQAHGILETCDDLFDPAVNLRAGLALYNYSYNRHDGNGWHPWKV